MKLAEIKVTNPNEVILHLHQLVSQTLTASLLIVLKLLVPFAIYLNYEILVSVHLLLLAQTHVLLAENGGDHALEVLDTCHYLQRGMLKVRKFRDRVLLLERQMRGVHQGAVV